MQSQVRAAEGVAARTDPCPNGALPFRHILGMRVDSTTYDEAVERILALARAGRGGSVCVATVHMIMEAVDDPAYRDMVNGADVVTSDGMPLVWILRRRGLPKSQRVYGPTLTEVLCERAGRAGLQVGFLGGREVVLDEMARALRTRFPDLQIAFRHSPPFREAREAEEREVLERIVSSGTQILFVGLGCPKQERFMARHRAALPCVQIGVGAAFDFIAGAKRQAPAFLQNAGLEWAFRLATEPRRLWRRYLRHNPRFVFRLLCEELSSVNRGDIERKTA